MWLKQEGIPKVDPEGSCFSFSLPGSTRQIHCLVMEKIEGPTLEEYLHEHGSISQDTALDWMHQILEILDKLHGHNILHRDLKPSNLLLRKNGKIAIVDFGAVGSSAATGNEDNTPSRFLRLRRPRTGGRSCQGTVRFLCVRAYFRPFAYGHLARRSTRDRRASTMARSHETNLQIFEEADRLFNGRKLAASPQERPRFIQANTEDRSSVAAIAPLSFSNNKTCWFPFSDRYFHLALCSQASTGLSESVQSRKFH